MYKIKHKNNAVCLANFYFFYCLAIFLFCVLEYIQIAGAY